MNYLSSSILAAPVAPLPIKLTNAKFRTTTIPAMAVDPRPGVQKVYIVWADDSYRSTSNLHSEVLMTMGTLNGSTWTFTAPTRIVDSRFSDDRRDQLMPAVAVDDAGALHVLFYSRIDNLTGKMNVYYALSTNGGTSFSVPQKLNDGGSINGKVQNQGKFIGDYIGIAARSDGLGDRVCGVWADTRRVRPGTSSKQQDVFAGAIK